MMRTSQIDQAWDQGPVAIRALRSLAQDVIEAVREAICDVPGPWSVERHDDYDGYLSVLISHERDTTTPTFLISGRVGTVEVATFHDDDLYTLGRFDNVEAAVTKLVSQLSLPSTP